VIVSANALAAQGIGVRDVGYLSGDSFKRISDRVPLQDDILVVVLTARYVSQHRGGRNGYNYLAVLPDVSTRIPSISMRDALLLIYR
jgi:hypothetical protein